MNYNRVDLAGKIMRVPTIREVGETSVTEFILEIERPVTRDNGQKDFDFIPIQIWGDLGLTASLHQGMKIFINGKIIVTKQGGDSWITKVEVIGDSFTIL